MDGDFRIRDAYKTFGDRLRQALEDHGYTQASFCQTVAISQDSLNCYVNGRRYPSLQVVLRFIEFLPGVDVTWLVTGQFEEERI